MSLSEIEEEARSATPPAASGGSRHPAARRRVLPLWERLLFTCIVVTVVASLPEIFLRITNLDRHVFSDPYENQIGFFKLLTYDPVLYWRGRAFAAIPDTHEQLNSRGFRGPEFQDAKPPGTLRVVCMGDSATFGLVNDVPNHFTYNPTYSGELGRMLKARFPGHTVEVMNAGVIGYSTLQGLRLLKFEVRHWQPDIITIRYGFNDHLGVEPNYFPTFEPRNLLLRWAQDTALEFRTYQFLTLVRTHIQWRAVTHGVPRGVRVPLEEFDYNLRRMVEEGRRTGARIILLTAPMAPLVPEITSNKSFLDPAGFSSYDALLATHREYEDAVRRVAAALQIDLVDSSRELEARGLGQFFSRYDVAHPNGNGHIAIAGELADLITAKQLIQ